MAITINTIELNLPVPHNGQRIILNDRERFNVIRCGRRFGKTQLGELLALEVALDAKPVGWFSPTYKLLHEVWKDLLKTLEPFGKLLIVNKSERIITLPNGGLIEFWSLDSHRAVRGRKYARAIIDEAAFVKDLNQSWNGMIRPTLADYRGDAYILSTPVQAFDYFNGSMYQFGLDNVKGWKSFSMPTITNPYIHPDEIEDARLTMPDAAFRNEFLAEPAESSQSPFGYEAIEAACVLEVPTYNPVDVWGVDLAKSVDWTVAIGLERNGDTAQFQRFQTDWRNTTSRLNRMLKSNFALVDSTGVGDPIVERLADGNPLVEGFKFTSTSRQSLLEGLATALQCGEVRFPKGIIEQELKSFRHEYSFKTGRARFSAPDGVHDDCVMAAALAVRARTSRPSRINLEVDDSYVDIYNEEDDWDLS